jgi:hypothetical protein
MHQTLNMARKRKNNSWDSCTWTGARREQLRRWGRLTLREKIKAVEEMGKVAAHFSKLRHHSETTAHAT